MCIFIINFKNTMESSQEVEVTKTIGSKLTSYNITASNNDLILYAISIGYGQDPLNTDHFKFVYENDDKF
jgi:hypothetical protein